MNRSAVYETKFYFVEYTFGTFSCDVLYTNYELKCAGCTVQVVSCFTLSFSPQVHDINATIESCVLYEKHVIFWRTCDDIFTGERKCCENCGLQNGDTFENCPMHN